MASESTRLRPRDSALMSAISFAAHGANDFAPFAIGLNATDLAESMRNNAIVEAAFVNHNCHRNCIHHRWVMGRMGGLYR